jgi:hypothetical protein
MSYLLVIAIAAAGALTWIEWALENGVLGFDFDGTLRHPAIAIRAGETPYPSPVVNEVEVGNPALYPPLLMLLVLPLTFLTDAAGTSVWIVVLAMAVVGALAIVGVRDLRCYALAMLSAPVIAGLIWGNATLVLTLPLALAWRYRDKWVLVGMCVGGAIAAKLFLWPVLFWLIGTRRYRASVWAVVCAIAALLTPWAVIAFRGFTDYPALLGTAEDVYAVHSYSIATMLAALGVATEHAVRLTLLGGVVLAVGALVYGRRRLDDASFSLAVLAAVIGSPIVWEHYYALLLVPVAVLRPRLSWPWAIFVLFYFTHGLPRPRLNAAELEPGGSACCRPPDVPSVSWVFNHAPSGLWPALVNALICVGIIAAAITLRRRVADSEPRPLVS